MRLMLKNETNKPQKRDNDMIKILDISYPPQLFRIQRIPTAHVPTLYERFINTHFLTYYFIKTIFLI